MSVRNAPRRAAAPVPTAASPSGEKRREESQEKSGLQVKTVWAKQKIEDIDDGMAILVVPKRRVVARDNDFPEGISRFSQRTVFLLALVGCGHLKG